MNTRLTLSIAVVMLVIGVVYMLDLKKTAKNTEEKYENSRVFHFSYEDVTYFSVFRNSELLSFEKKDGLWFLTSPENALAEEAYTDNLLNIALNLTVEKVVEKDPSNLSEFGLQPPFMILTLKSADKEQSVLIGAQTYSQISYFAKRDGNNELFTVNNIGLTDFESSFNKFISNSIVVINPKKSYFVSIKTEKNLMELSRSYDFWSELKDNSRWNVNSENADKEKVEHFLLSLKSAEIFKNHGKALNKNEIEEKSVITIVFKQDSLPDEILFISEGETGFYRCFNNLSGDLYDVKKSVLDNIIPKDYKYFLDLHLMKNPISLYEKIEISYKNDKGTIEIKRDKSNNWKLIKDDENALNNILMTLQELEYNPDSEFTSKVELYLTIFLKGFTEDISDNIEIYKAGEKYFTKISEKYYEVDAKHFLKAISQQ